MSDSFKYSRSIDAARHRLAVVTVERDRLRAAMVDISRTLAAIDPDAWDALADTDAGRVLDRVDAIVVEHLSTHDLLAETRRAVEAAGE